MRAFHHFRPWVVAAALSLSTTAAQAQDPADTLTAQQRYAAALDTVAELDATIALIDSWDVGLEGIDGPLLEERRAVRTRSRRALLWRLADLVRELAPADPTDTAGGVDTTAAVADTAVSADTPAETDPTDAADGRDPRVAMVDSLLRADMQELAVDVDEWLDQASVMASEAMSMEGAARARAQAQVHEIDTAIDGGLVALYRSLEARDSLGTDMSEVYAGLDPVLGVRAELLAGRMARAENDIASLQDRIDQGVTGLEEEIAALDLDVNQTADNLESVLELMEERGMPTADFRRYLLVSTGTLTAENLNLDVLGGVVSDWLESARRWFAESGWNLVLHALAFIAILAMARLLALGVNRLVVSGLQASRLNLSHLLRDTIVRWSTRIVMLLGLLIALSQIGVELGPVLAGLGVAGFVIGFALQDTLSNFASGVMILLYRPFDVDDIVEVGGVVGRVADMSLVSTTILSVDNQRYIIPNSKIWGDVIQNVTAESTRRVDLVFGIGYEDDIPEAERILEEVVAQHELVLDDPAPLVKLSELGDSSVNFIVRPWCRTSDYWDVRFDVTRQVKLRFDEAGISIPFPQRDVHVYHEGLEAAEVPSDASEGSGSDSVESSVPVPDRIESDAAGTERVGSIMRGEEGLDEADQTPS